MAERVAKAPADRERVSRQDMETQLAYRYRDKVNPQAAAPKQGVPDSPPAETTSTAKPVVQQEAPKEPPAPEPTAESKHVPYDRFREVNDKAKEATRLREEAESRAKAAEERLAQLEQESKSRRVEDLLNRVRSGKDDDISTDEILTLIDTVTDEKLSTVQRNLEEIRAQREVTDQLAEAGMTREQRAAVLDLMERKGLDLDDAVVLAQAKRGDLFTNDSRSFSPAQHGSQRPGRTGPPPQQSPFDRVRQAGSHKERSSAALDVIRGRLARRGSA